MPFFDKLENRFHVEMVDNPRWVNYGDFHFHDGCELYYLLEGSINYLIEDSVYKITEGDIVYIPKNTLHKTIPGDREKHKRLLFSFAPTYIEGLMVPDEGLDRFLSQADVVRLSALAPKRRAPVLLMLEMLAAEFFRDPRPENIAIPHLLGTLLINLNRLTEQATPASLPTTDEMPEVLQAIISFMHQNHQEDISLKLLSERFFISEVYISVLFKKHLGASYTTCLTKIRIQNAVRMLLNTDKKISDIAGDCGYNSCNHFCKMFRRHMNDSPTAFRAKNR